MKSIVEQIVLFFSSYNYNLLNNIWFAQRSKTHKEAHLGAPFLVHLFCPGKIQMSNCQPPEFTLLNTKIYNIICHMIKSINQLYFPFYALLKRVAFFYFPTTIS